jgi:hypothetical protein
MSGNPRGRETKAQRQAKLDAIVADWCAPYGGVASLKPAEKALAYRAAEMSLRRPARNEDMTRTANAIARILHQCGLVDRRRRREPAPARQVGDLL